MKIRTKLALLLCAALVATTLASTVLQVQLTVRQLERQARWQALEAAQNIKVDLEKDITIDSDEEDISEELKAWSRRHQVAIELAFNDEQDATVSFSLGLQEAEPKIKSTPRPSRKRPAVRRDEIRRALTDHGDTARAPSARLVEPMWRTPDRSDSPAWAALVGSQPPPRKPPKAFVVDVRDEPQRQARAWAAQVELTQPRRGLLTVRVSMDQADRVAKNLTLVSAGVGGTATLLLLVISVLIANRIVGRPVAELASAMRIVGGGDLSRRVAERGLRRDRDAGRAASTP